MHASALLAHFHVSGESSLNDFGSGYPDLVCLWNACEDGCRDGPNDERGKCEVLKNKAKDDDGQIFQEMFENPDPEAWPRDNARKKKKALSLADSTFFQGRCDSYRSNYKMTSP